MGWRIGGAGRFGPHRVGGLAMSTGPGKDSMDEGGMEVTLEELREFLEGGRIDVQARPEFKEGLRERLWSLVREGRRRWQGPRS